jgi:hypothetical protein
MFDETFQFLVVQVNQFPDFQIEDLFQLGDLHDVYVFGLDKIFHMDRGESPFSGKREKVQNISVIAAVFIDPDVFKEKGGSFKSLRDFEMLVSDGLIVMDIFRPYPWRF